MSDKSNGEPVHEHEGFFERIFHPHRHQHQKDKEEDHDDHKDDQPHEPMKDKGAETDKLKDDVHKDGGMIQEGYDYDRLI